MGYRPTFELVNDGTLSYYGTKLYGYFDCKKLLSFRYLVSLGKLSEDTLFDYGMDNEIILSEKDFALFIDLYELDMRKYRDPYFSFIALEHGIVRKLVNTPGYKRIYWC